MRRITKSVFERVEKTSPDGADLHAQAPLRLKKVKTKGIFPLRKRGVGSS